MWKYHHMQSKTTDKTEISLSQWQKKASSKSTHIKCVAPAYRLNFPFNSSDCVWFESSNVPTVKKEETLVLIAATKTIVWKISLKMWSFVEWLRSS